MPKRLCVCMRSFWLVKSTVVCLFVCLVTHFVKMAIVVLLFFFSFQRKIKIDFCAVWVLHEHVQNLYILEIPFDSLLKGNVEYNTRWHTTNVVATANINIQPFLFSTLRLPSCPVSNVYLYSIFIVQCTTKCIVCDVFVECEESKWNLHDIHLNATCVSHFFFAHFVCKIRNRTNRHKVTTSVCSSAVVVFVFWFPIWVLFIRLFACSFFVWFMMEVFGVKAK